MMLKLKMQDFNKIVRYAHDGVLQVKLGLKLEQSSKTLTKSHCDLSAIYAESIHLGKAII